MRFSVLLSGLFAVMAAAETTSAPATAVSMSPAQASQLACYKACPEGDVNCQAHCVAVPSPDGAQANATTQCVAKCPQGNGSAADTKAFGDCIQKCINNHYFVTSKGTPEATGAAGGNNAANSNTDSAAAPTGTGSSESSGTESGAAPTGSATKSSGSSSTKTGSASTTSTTNAAPAIIASGGAFVGVIAALMAL
ncbi:uncharacterized protein TrAFT101_001639 [Trichoderma asperellum]|uniref:Extracellular membrane protein CFEM domain-containing protein n=1 Tax=Trichoderma asperellum (strain ATCC 204424 / CBS 433.97 / NBRC 101777) TaxID=1042311 RepID=A0A2T3ZE68_TRIA4|nr:hypothetical protein M441DRAFT_365388 [Trichoderma asperellum CBS 433.97]PTB43080.1 hypothetical protein M441DRAFT_365388 [Trichoderma asperellum CBS 433.97]UKZ85794.1 hypothetical protein TrAFT101_001639 [Trichoderma asperellum]